MNSNIHTIKRAISGFALAAAVAAFVVPSALGSGGNFYHPRTGATRTQTDGYAAVMESHFKHEDALYTKTVGTSSQCPCNLGLPGGPTVSTTLAGSSTPVIQTRGGFDWNLAGTGAGAALGLALIAFAVGSKTNRDWNIKKRRRLARALERASVPERPFIGRGPRYLVQPSVTLACAPSLRTIATALRDETRVLDVDGLRAVLTFITDGGSPFFGRDTTDALREVVRLQHNVIGAETAALDLEPMAVAV